MLHLVLLLASLPSSSSSFSLSCSYRTLPGRIRSDLGPGPSAVSSAISCVRLCRCSVRCSASFNTATGLCRPVPLAGILLPVALQADPGWVTLTPDKVGGRSVVLSVPSGLWPLDDVHLGRNLGMEGRALDAKVAGLVWNQEGPRKSIRRYPKIFNGTGSANISLLSGPNLLVDFLKPYSIAIWVKTNNSRDHAFILESHPRDSNAELWFWPSMKQLYLGVGDFYYQTVINSTGVDGWRHVAVTYNGPGQVQFYLNGHPWAIEKNSTYFAIAPQAKYLCLFRHCQFAGRFYYGTLACLVLYEKALSSSEVKMVMDTCP